jgi:AraC-like DNA-binding protein
MRRAKPGSALAKIALTRSHDYTLVALRGALYAGLIRNSVSGDEVARQLQFNRRTLNRRLKEAGTTFQQVLDQVRFELAREMLSGTHLHVAEIAARLGYRVPSAFTRAFRRWSGSSPARWRAVTTPTRDRAHLRGGP